MLRSATSSLLLATQIEHMNSASKRAKGLLKFERAPENYAAVFSLPLWGFFPMIHTFGMKFPIDVVFCDFQKKILWIQRSVGPGQLILPWRYILGGCRYLVEFSDCETESLQVGDILEWESSI